ncbi:MAG: cupin domain-containing protein [Pseudanabaena sp.]|jgi:predicted ChrR family anti-sigma factor|uniref:cupin domain-containing protein n=1 Tax=Microcystis sp. M087S2 TaxID=2771176 RepID=UPI0025842F79|nr:cupin domain-containing protein [Microcystis sp. M087S2]MCA6504073.1 cupin domain-containing protein [Pseudanabaena sp. M090S1SP2A07QC]MCA6505689.1 cupin domain-containing protein [Pseudanabaena sp. M172S2SP2A07QC]MCA6518036.1 cupin domain-containing protein [Pseudanabaena sp. M110S1SP2A07QC]MCA6520492.1 cupin domain-containing protein [Pseudanabaena sp. M051S1SP2A07QC]MCA6526455.1 cupin domain-containing protein [Pseudanabaena sp. M179S2SP2A07QC]MCA6530171.1 cupin domain-containing protei
MIINQKIQVFPELLTRSSYDDLPWEPFRQGVEIYPLYKNDMGASAALLRYEAGAKVPHHSHSGYEHIFVLSGSQADAHGKYTKGSVVINSPDTSHQVSSEEGCVVLIVWEKPVIINE